MTKKDIAVKIAKEANLPQEKAAYTIQRTLEYISEELAAGRAVELRNFGIFEVKVCKKRIGRNPRKPETDIVIPERAVVKFRAGKILKNKVEKLVL